MEKVLIIYFTGTGNSKRVAEIAKSEFETKGYEADIVDVCSDRTININDYDNLIISYPIYAFNAPVSIIKYVKRFAKAAKTINCLIIKNSGEYLSLNNASSLQLSSILKRKNIKVLSEYHYLMPYSFVFRHTDYMAYKMISTLNYLLPIDINDYLNGKYHKLHRFIFDRPFSFIFRIQRFGGRLNGRLYKIDYDKCLKCNKCMNNCPGKNITKVDDKYKFGKTCLMCQRCAMYCPSQAIKVGMFQRWRVGGPYSFRETTTFEKEKKPKYCAKSYKKYFLESEERINGSVNE